MRNLGFSIVDFGLKKRVIQNRLLADRRAYSLTFWTIFFGFILIPILALSIELGRYFYARAEVAKSADAAALAAAAEINQRIFEETGDLQPTSRTWANAQAFASMNNIFLKRYGVDGVVTGIVVDAGKDTVLVEVSANLERLFPSVVPEIVVTEGGYAEIRAFTR
jgi:Flp pilus assembly protein TadG